MASYPYPQAGPSGFRPTDTQNAEMIDPADINRVANYGALNKQYIENREAKTAAMASALSEKPVKKNWFYTVYATQIGLATLSGLATAAILYIVNPPITQIKRTDPCTQEKQDWKKVLLMSAIVLFIVFIIPDVLILLHVFDRK